MKLCSFATLTLLALGLTVCRAPAAAEDAVLLRYAWKKGDFIATVRTVTLDQSEEIAGKPVKKSTVGQEVAHVCHVLDVNDRGEAEIESHLAYFTMQLRQGDRSLGRMDSRRMQQDELCKFLTSASYRFRVSDRGQILEVKGLEEVMDDFRTKIETYVKDKKERAALDLVIEGLFGKDNVNKTLSLMMVPYPREKVSTADRWQRSFRFPFEGIAMSLGLEYRLDQQGIRERRLGASGRLTLTSKIEGVRFEVPRGSMAMTVGADSATGLPRWMKGSLDFEMKAYANRPGERRLLARFAARVEEEATFKVLREDPTSKLAAVPRPPAVTAAPGLPPPFPSMPLYDSGRYRLPELPKIPDYIHRPLPELSKIPDYRPLPELELLTFIDNGEEQNNSLEALTFNDDGTRVIAQTYSSDVARRKVIGTWPLALVLDVNQGKEVRRVRGSRSAQTFSTWRGLSKRGDQLVSLAGGKLEVYDVGSGRFVRTIVAPTGGWHRLAVDGCGTRAAVVSNYPRELRVWNLATGKELKKVWPKGSSLSFRAVALTSDGKRVVVGGADLERLPPQESGRPKPCAWVGVFDADSGQELATLSRPGLKGIHSLVLAPDDTLAASVSEGGTIQVWDLSDKKAATTITEVKPYKYSLSCPLAFFPDGKRLAIWTELEALSVRDVATGKKQYDVKARFPVAFRTDGKRMASEGRDGTVQVWDVTEWGMRELIALRLDRSRLSLLKFRDQVEGKTDLRGGSGRAQQGTASARKAEVRPREAVPVGARQVVGVDSHPPRAGMAPFGIGIRSGNSILTVSNGTQTDAVVKLIQLGSPKRHVRNFYIPQGKSYTTREIPPGDYVLRVAFGKDWDRTDRKFTSERSFSQTQTFDITEEKTARGIRYTRLRITLHKVVDGNFRSNSISEADFSKE